MDNNQMKYMAMCFVLFSWMALSLLAQDEPQNLADSDGNLYLYRYEGGSMAIYRRDKSRTLISTAKGIAARRIYDGNGRLSRVQMWSSSQNAYIREETYSYGTGKNPSRCIITDGDKSSGSWTVTDRRFNEDGKVAEERVWFVELAEDKDTPSVANEAVQSAIKSKKEVRHLLKVVTTAYGIDGNVTEVTTITKGNDSKKHTVREVYDGLDTYRYENGILRMSTVHTASASDDSNGNYTSTVIFGDGDGQVKIVTDYKDGHKVSSTVVR